MAKEDDERKQATQRDREFAERLKDSIQSGLAARVAAAERQAFQAQGGANAADGAVYVIEKDDEAEEAASQADIARRFALISPGAAVEAAIEAVIAKNEAEGTAFAIEAAHRLGLPAGKHAAGDLRQAIAALDAKDENEAMKTAWRIVRLALLGETFSDWDRRQAERDAHPERPDKRIPVVKAIIKPDGSIN